MSVRGAALKLQIKPRTAQRWVQQDQQNSTGRIEKSVSKGKSAGEPPKLVEQHRQFLVNLVDEKPALVLDEIMESLTAQFADLDIKKSALHAFLTDNCKISLKRAHVHSVERNSAEQIESEACVVTRSLQTDMDYLSSCVFVGEAAYHINMKRSYTGSKNGTPAVKVPKTGGGGLTITVLGAVSPFGIVNVSVRRPRAKTPPRNGNGRKQQYQ